MNAESGLSIPSLEELDPFQPDYVQKLDENWEKLEALGKRQREKMKFLFDKGPEDLKYFLRGIEGLVVEGSVPLSETVKEGGEVVAGVSIEAVLLGYNAKDRREDVSVRRKIEDTIRNHRRAYENKQRDLEEGILKIERAKEDFAGAIGDLTKIMPLTEISLSNHSLHYYIARKDGVYEAHVVIEPPSSGKQPTVSLNGPCRNQYLKEADFSTPDFLRQFAEQSKEIKANAYFVANPSEVPTPKILFIQAALDYAQYASSEISKKLEGIAKQERESSVLALVNSIKRGMGESLV